MNAADILKAALDHMEDRAATYDKPEGERSMPATVAAFNTLTGHTLTAEQGWLFMTVLKLCRTQQGGFRADNYEDGSAYFALMGEQASGDRVPPATGGIKPGMEAPVNLVDEVMDADRLANSSQSATHRDGGGTGTTVGSSRAPTLKRCRRAFALCDRHTVKPLSRVTVTRLFHF